VNFMMFPLCTRVTFGRLSAMAYSIAALTRRFEPSSLIGFTPMPQRSGNRIDVTFISRRSQAMTLSASGEPAFHSIPA